MYLKQNDILLLVNALSRAEKKSLTLFLSTLPKVADKNYIYLLESIYNGNKPSKLKAMCAPQAHTNAKRRLYKNVLKSLRSHHDQKSVDIIISNLLCEVEILYDLSLPGQAMVMLRKAFNHAEAYKNSKKLLSNKMRDILHNDFLEGIFEHITSCVCMGKFEEALSSMDLADRYIARQKYDQSPTFLLRTFYFKVIYKLLIYYYMGDVEKLSLSVKDAEDKLYLFDMQLSLEMKQVIYSNLKNAYAILGDIGKSENIIEEVLKKGPKATRKDMYDDAMLFKLFILLQTETYVLLPSAALSAQRYFKQFIQDKNYNDVEYKIANVLQREHNWENKQARHAVLQEIKKILESCIAGTVGLSNFQEFYTYFIIWTNSLLSERPFHEEAAAWYGQYKVGNVDQS